MRTKISRQRRVSSRGGWASGPSLRLIILLIMAIVLIGGCVEEKECKTNEDCLAKTCFTTQCKDDNTCLYSPIADCCGNEQCERGETYDSCPADCPSCTGTNECGKASYDYNQQKCIIEPKAPCYSRLITLAPATPEIDYQVRIELTSSDFGYAKAKANGEDIRFFDKNDNPLDYWIEDWDGPGRVSIIWVKVPGSGTDEIYMYYGHPTASSASSASTVFDFFDDFNYSDEKELTQVWSKYGDPVIELSDGIVTIADSGAEQHQGQHIFKNIGSAVLLNSIVEMNAKRFPGNHSHMANIGYTAFVGGPIGDNNAWAALRYSPSMDGGYVVFGSNHGGIAPSPVGSFNVIKIYHQDGVSYAYEPPDTKVAEYRWQPPLGDYILLGGATTLGGNGKASYDWIRIRKFSSPEPVATFGKEEVVGEGAGPVYD